jgi:hypothetical protein
MGSKDRPVEWQREFAEFSAAESTEVPDALSGAILGRVEADLHPSPFRVFAKVAAIHAGVGAATLLACPQFGLSYFGNHGLMHYLMQYGEGVCMLGCGAFFTVFSVLAASLVLRPEEVRAFKGNEILQLASLVTLSIGAFLFAGGTIVFTLALIWSLGAILGGAISLEAGWAIRKTIIRRSLV